MTPYGLGSRAGRGTPAHLLAAARMEGLAPIASPNGGVFIGNQEAHDTGELNAVLDAQQLATAEAAGTAALPPLVAVEQPDAARTHVA